jgi:uncharacterized repeat protein (TIGR01451 family)
VTQATQTITFTAPTDRPVSDPPFAVSPTGGASGQPVVVASQTPSVCTTSGTNGTTITLVGSGTCTLRASQAGNAVYAAAANVDRSFQVGGAVSDIQVSLADGLTQVQSGASYEYVVVVHNAGPAAVTGLVVDVLPTAGVAFSSWSCAPESTAPCPVPASGGAGAVQVVVNLPAGSSLSLEVSAVADGATTATAIVQVVTTPAQWLVGSHPRQRHGRRPQRHSTLAAVRKRFRANTLRSPPLTAKPGGGVARHPMWSQASCGCASSW